MAFPDNAYTHNNGTESLIFTEKKHKISILSA